MPVLAEELWSSQPVKNKKPHYLRNVFMTDDILRCGILASEPRNRQYDSTIEAHALHFIFA